MNYLKKAFEKREAKINVIFNNSLTFEARLRRIFENIDRKRTAERQLYELRQKKSAVIYLINFQYITTNTK